MIGVARQVKQAVHCDIHCSAFAVYISTLHAVSITTRTNCAASSSAMTHKVVITCQDYDQELQKHAKLSKL